MSTSEKEFLSLLFEEGTVLENLKFFPGEDCSSREELCAAAHDLISRALAGEGEGLVPVSGVAQKAIGDLAAAF